ncbi:hypothetical protein PROFUN_14740 [Planoprotostelium fungivorum]|uniref:Uncharacterized protein n=1 Tax=Planoprotostelium fungivorum TaxID=1890364 RepID=A0A2P6MXX2_9EUKA|nr:hypothetical protein PROFUN_14740 [Planoprotostelium fungivorum]
MPFTTKAQLSVNYLDLSMVRWLNLWLIDWLAQQDTGNIL